MDTPHLLQAVDRVSTISLEKGRAVKLNLSNGRMVLSVTNPDSGSAEEEMAVDYGGEPLEIGFNARYLLDVASQIGARQHDHPSCRLRLAHHRARPGVMSSRFMS